MKKITGIRFVRTAEGLRVSYSYSDIDADGNVTASNQIGSYINLDSDTETFVESLESSILNRMTKEGKNVGNS